MARQRGFGLAPYDYAAMKQIVRRLEWLMED
jgi:hypothetical protein